MVWSRVTRVGCGLITHYNQDTAPLIARYYVCDYGPGGNKVVLGMCESCNISDDLSQVGELMYTPGPACSACPGGTSCRGRHQGLCSGRGADFIDDNSLDDVGRTFSSRLFIMSSSLFRLRVMIKSVFLLQRLILFSNI